MSLVELIALDRCRRRGGTFIERGDRELAVFILGDPLHPPEAIVIDNTCPHANGNLSADKTYGNVVTAVKEAVPSKPRTASAPADPEPAADTNAK